MNLLGKLLIVLIFIGSILLAAFSVTLYSTHTNWREQHTRVSATLAQRTQELTDLQRQKDSLEAALRLEIRNQVSRSIALADRVRQLTEDKAALEVDNHDLSEKLELAIATAESSLTEMAALRDRLDGQSKALADAQREWQEMLTELIKKMDEAHSLAILVSNYQATAAKLAVDYRNAMEVLRRHGHQPDPALYPEMPPAGIHGYITEVRPRGNVEISIGSDSGLANGHQLDVVRNRDGRSSYVGKIEIIDVAADRASARVMSEFRMGVAQRGDEVMYIDVGGLVAIH